MSSHHICHIALRVESLSQAARFYACLFDLEVLSAADPRLLGRGSFLLMLTSGAVEPAGSGRLAHVCLSVPSAAMGGLGHRAASLGCRIMQQTAEGLMLEDLYGIRWHVVAD